MTRGNPGRLTLTAAIGVAAAVCVLATSGEAQAGRRKKKARHAAEVVSLQTPLGLQGVRGAGNAVAVPFSLVDKSRRKTDIDVEYGWDGNNVDGKNPDHITDGIISDGSDPNLPSEYSPATEDRRDSRNTRKNKKPQLFSTAGDIGASHAFVWNSSADVSSGNFPTLRYAYTAEGRRIPDPDNPGQFIFDSAQPGVKIRIRASGKGGAKGEWAYSDSFALNNNTPPEMTIDSVTPNATSVPTASDELVEIKWTAYDADSEDFNGNGVLDPLDLEDVNGNGRLDPENVAAAFDFWRVPDGVDPTTFTAEELDVLLWQPCTKYGGVVEPFDGLPSAPPPVGRQHSFTWDSVADVGTVNAQFILRARPFDEKREEGPTVYFAQGFRLDNWKIFNSPGAGSTLPGGRVGATIVNLTPGLPRSDPAYEPPLQSVLVAGGATTADGPGTSYLAVQIVNTETAETTTSSIAPFTSLTDARSYHTATVLDDGRVLFTGGFGAGGQPLATTEIYDPATHSMTPGPDLLIPRAKHTAVRLVSGHVAIFGGVTSGGQVTATAEVFNAIHFSEPATADSALPDMAVAQHSLHAVLLPDQRVLVTGGIDAAGNAVQTAEALNPLYDQDPSDPTTKNPRFESVGPMLAPRKFGSATALIDGNVLFAGGGSPAVDTAEVFNWTNRTFEPVNFLLAGGAVATGLPGGARAQHVAVRLGDSSVLLAGGTTNPTGGALVADADVVLLGSRDSATATWSATSLPVNGDMRFPRRLAAAATINNGRVMIVGGLNATGGALAELETYTPENGVNFRPYARTQLQSQQQSWAFGAPIVYRVTDPEGDPVRVNVQWSITSGETWEAAASQPSTIGGDVAEVTAPVTTGTFDDTLKAISPALFPVSDHKYIWSMTQDIPRPPPGDSSGPYIFRVVPFGAVQGKAGASVPVTVLYNTKIIPTILPMESRTGVPGAQQGGDISVWIHLRDIDGPGTGPRNGDLAAVEVEYAVDTNGDGIINPGAEFWLPASRTGAGVDPSQRQNNYVTNLETWSEAAADAGPAYGERDPAMGWVMFPWDSVFDLGAPAGAVRNIQIRVVPYDNLSAAEPDEGFHAVVLNEPGKPDAFVLVRDPDALWLRDFLPAGGNVNSVAVNEPIDMVFSGIVDPATVTTDTIQVRRNGSVVEGVFTVTQDVPGKTSTVRFFPALQNTDQGQPYYGAQSNPTVLFPFTTYSVYFPGYTPGTDPTLGTTLRPDNAGPPTVTQTYLLAQNVDQTENFTTNSGHYDDGVVASVSAEYPVTGSTLLQDDTVSYTLTGAVDPNTVKSPNITVTIDNAGGATASRASSAVVPGNWSVTNVLNPDGSRSSAMTFTPLMSLPSGATLVVASNGGLLTASGRPVATIGTSYAIDAYGRVNTSFTESFSDTSHKDTGYTANPANWGDDACAPGTLTGLQDGSTQPQGGNDLTVNAGQTVTISNQTSDYGSITVNSRGVLRIRATAGAALIRAAGNIRIMGTVDFRGEDGWTGAFGNTSSSTYYYYATQGVGTRQGGRGYNAGGGGGDSQSSSSSSSISKSGDDGDGPQAGQGGQHATRSDSYYIYGGGGGAGGGNGQRGLPGGRATNYYDRGTIYGAPSVPGGTNGDRQMTNGTPEGSGGGGGGSNRYSSRWYHQGGAGGAGAGAVTFLCDGVFELAPSGLIDGRGGAGGGSCMLAGSGGGGSGGGLHIKSGGACTLDGVIDLRGGKGGPAHFSTWSDYYTQRNAYTYGTARHGGDGGGGRLVVEAPNFLNYNDVRVKGQLMVKQVTSLPTSSIGSASSPPGVFISGGSYNTGTTTQLRFTNLVVPSNAVVDLTGSKALTIYVDGTVQIDGTIRLNGQRPSKGFSGNATSPVSGIAPEFDGEYGTPSTAYVGGVGRMGGGSGGAGHTIGGSATQTNDFKRRGANGTGPAPGTNYAHSGSGYAWSGTSYQAFSGDNGGSGAGNATDGDHGWAPYAMSSRYDYSGAATDSSGNGVDPVDVLKTSPPVGGRIDPTNISVATLDQFVGSGGGGGNLGGYSYTPCSWHYIGMTGSAGGAGGGFGIVGSGTVTVNGTIEAKGADGNPPGAGAMSVLSWNWSASSYSYIAYQHSGGGGGSGGTVYIVGDEVNIGTATSEASGGATFDMSGGMGGGWRQFANRGVSNRNPAYNALGNFGGDGGFGRLVINYRTSLNNGNTLFNRYGMEQTAFPGNDDRWTSLAGSAYAACRGFPGGNTFQSTWYDLGSITPVVNGMSFGSVSDATYTLLGEGAQSHPHNVGAGTGEADANNTSGFQSPGVAMLDGWRWLRFQGTLARATTNPSAPPPRLDALRVDYRTDN